MRVVAVVASAVVASAISASAGAQVGWVGAAVGRSWTWDREGATLLGGGDVAVGLLLGVSLDGDALLRLRAAELPMAHPPGAAMRTLALGVDYLFPGVLGEAAFSAGVGGARLLLPQVLRPDPYHGRWELGYYLGVGEWIPLGRRTRLTLEITWDRSRHRGTPTLLSGMAGVAVGL